MRDQYFIRELCEALGVNRSGYYAARRRPSSRRAQENEELFGEMNLIHTHRHTLCYGSPRMTAELRARGCACSINRVARIMKERGLRARPRSPFRPKTTCQNHAASPSPNLLAEIAAPEAPGRQIVSDITYIPTRQGWLYLSIVLDLFSRCVLGWNLSASLKSTGVAAALQSALKRHRIAPGAIFHSDRGCQYSAWEVRTILARAHLQQSMSVKGYCYDNAFAESAFASIKSELLPQSGIFETQLEARRAIFDYLETFYNRKRRHSALAYRSPETFLNLYFQNQNLKLN
jgi:transposase InsO family protein